MRENKKKYIKYIILVIVSLLAAVSVIKGIYNALDGQRIDFLHKEFREILFEHDSSNIVQFPSTMLFIYLLGLFPYRTAQIIWLIMQFVFTGMVIYYTKRVLFEKWDAVDYAILSLVMISGAPWRTNLSNLQYTLCSFAFFMLGLYLMREGHDIWAGLA